MYPDHPESIGSFEPTPPGQGPAAPPPAGPLGAPPPAGPLGAPPGYGPGQPVQGGYQQPYPPQAPLGPPPQMPVGPPKSKIAAGLLSIFLGCFGVGRFYLGFTGVGVAQLLITVLSAFFLSPVTAIWGLIEGILILVAQPGTRWALDARGRPLAS